MKFSFVILLLLCYKTIIAVTNDINIDEDLIIVPKDRIDLLKSSLKMTYEEGSGMIEPLSPSVLSVITTSSPPNKNKITTTKRRRRKTTTKRRITKPRYVETTRTTKTSTRRITKPKYVETTSKRKKNSPKTKSTTKTSTRRITKPRYVKE